MKSVLFILCLVVASTYSATKDEDGLYARVENLFKHLKGLSDPPMDEVEV